MAEDITPDTRPALAELAQQTEAKRVLESIKASSFKPVYEPLDLGEISPEFSGQTLQVLRNPSQLFRRAFLDLDANSNDFIEWAGYIFDMTPAQAREWLDIVDQALYVFFFMRLFVAATETLPAHWQHCALIEIWNTYATGRAKKFHAR